MLCVDVSNCRYVKCNTHCCVFDPGMWWEVRGLTQWESVERKGRGQCAVLGVSGFKQGSNSVLLALECWVEIDHALYIVG